MVKMTVSSSEMAKRLYVIEKSNELPDISMTFRQRIYYFLFPSAKFERQSAERYKKNLRRGRNQRYYAKHSDRIRARRKERYDFCGE